MGSLHNRNELKNVRRALRSNATASEAVLWSYLSGGKLAGRKFRRQHSIGPFILDLYCPSERLCIEIDGGSHDDPTASANDRSRDDFLLAHGIRTLRFSNKEIIDSVEAVVRIIEAEFR
jgi:very-short-patch-repair endonuclease